MGLFRRLLSGPGAAVDRDGPAAVAADLEAEEREHELENLRGEQDRLDDLAQRQLRYAQYAWRPPAQGGARRADDEDRPTDHP